MFNVRDLMVNLAAHAGGQAQQPAIFCAATCDFSCHICTGTCYDTRVGCGGRSYCGFTLTIVEVNPAGRVELSVLKEQLRQALAEVEKQERSGSENR